MLDCKITKATVNESDELQLNIRVSPGNWTENERQILKDAKLKGNEVTLSIEGLNVPTKDETEQRIKDKRQILASSMDWYARETNQKLHDVTDKLYSRYGIKSRTELTESELDEEIASYKAGAIHKE